MDDEPLALAVRAAAGVGAVGLQADDHAARDGAGDAEGVAEGEDELARPERHRVADGCGVQTRRIYGKHGEVEPAAASDEARLQQAAVAQDDLGGAATDDVRVRHDEAVVAPDDARAAAPAGDLDLHERVPDAFHGVRERTVELVDERAHCAQVCARKRRRAPPVRAGVRRPFGQAV